jgi:hypothetical protein
MARSIESLLDLNTMSIEELTGRLKVCEEDDDTTGNPIYCNNNYCNGQFLLQ